MITKVALHCRAHKWAVILASWPQPHQYRPICLQRASPPRQERKETCFGKARCGGPSRLRSPAGSEA